VFVIGCHRSGTNLLYDTLLSAGSFAVYRGYLPIYKMLIPRFGTLDKPENRERLIATWLRSKGFRRSGLEAQQLASRLRKECRTGGDFLRITMDQIAQAQNAIRWAVYDPDNVLYIPRIKADIPDALFLHIIRDGRDVALSLQKMEGFRPLPWHRGNKSLQATALYWEWMVGKGQRYGREIPADYMEVRYEELVTDPRRALAVLSTFLGQDLDYDRIQRAGLGRLNESNSSFREDAEQERANPVNRWKEKLSRQEIAALEAVAGACLEKLGYALETTKEERGAGLREIWMRAAYRCFLDGKQWMKIKTPAGRFASLSALELADVPGSTHAAKPRPGGLT
jgi:hypothetical protein